MNDSMTRLIKPLITCICAHFRQTNQICSKLFFLNQSKHILIFIQELCIYKTIAFYDSSLVIKKISKFFFFRFFFLPSCSLLAPPRESVRAPPVENHWLSESVIRPRQRRFGFEHRNETKTALLLVSYCRTVRSIFCSHILKFPS